MCHQQINICGAEPTIKDKSGKTPLDLAKEGDYDEIASIIEERLKQRKKRQKKRSY
jgi:hypothetical protein